MSKYTFVLYHKRQEEFLERLQELGLVDITSTDWEPDDQERAMIISLEQHRAAESSFKELEDSANKTGFKAGKPFDNGEEAFEQYLKATSEIENLKGRIEKARKEADELAVWGDFSPESLRDLAQDGIALRFFSVYASEFSKITEKWGEELMIEKISEHDGHTYFVVVLTEPLDIPFDAQEYRMPDMTSQEKAAHADELEKELEKWQKVLARAYASADMISAHAEEIKERLDFSRASNSGLREAENTLVIMEGWATRESSENVDKMLEEYPDVVYIKERPTPHDNTPVVLKNNKFASAFEVIGSFYSLPRYGTLDLTAFFGPFYMLFFGFCLGDAGYGLVLLLAGIFIRIKKPQMRSVANLTMLCGGAAVVFGFLVGSFFGIPLGETNMFSSLRDRFLETENLFVISLMLGVVQIYFGLILRVVNTTKQFRFKYALGTIGWMMVLPVIVIAIFGMLMPDVEALRINFSSPYVLAPVGVGLVLMLFFHNPEKNPLLNFGSGLWNTYNDVTGFLGDFLSYIRLFALCLSGGTLAVVFNDLAIGLAPEIPVVRQLVMIIILLFGHLINLFMSALGAFVHPMRLTFVEFYKNAGFESSQREFAPLKKNSRTDKQAA